MVELLLARHGESTSSAEGLVNGDPSVRHGLTAQGRAQAEALGRDLAGRRIDLCVTTRFLRTVETADLALADRPEPPPREVWPVLDDARFGSFEGRPLAEYRRWIREHGAGAAPPGGGESRAGTIERFCAGLVALADRDERTILVVAHGILLAAVVAAAAGEEVSLIVDQPPYGAFRRFDVAAVTAAVEALEAWVTAERAA